MGIFHHVGQENPEDRVVQRIHPVVPDADFPGGHGVAPNEGFQGVGKHLTRHPGHLHDLRLRRDRPGLDQPLGGLGDVHRVVADPLEIVGDLEGGGEHPEVAGHRLLESEEVDGLLLDFHLHVVHHAVALDDRLGFHQITIQQGLHRHAQGRFGLPRHGEQPDLDVIQLVVKVTLAVDGHPNLPVMYASVRSFAGEVKIRSVSSNSISSPRSKKPVKSETRAACCMLCVTMTMV